MTTKGCFSSREGKGFHMRSPTLRPPNCRAKITLQQFLSCGPLRLLPLRKNSDTTWNGRGGLSPSSFNVSGINPRNRSRNDVVVLVPAPAVDPFRLAFHCTGRRSQPHHRYSRSLGSGCLYLKC